MSIEWKNKIKSIDFRHGLDRLYFVATSWILSGHSPLANDSDFDKYRVAVAGLAYLGLGRYFALIGRRLADWLYVFGLLAFFGSIMALGGWRPQQHLFWELLFPLLTAGGLLLSVRWQSNAFLAISAIYLVAYIGKITSEYFWQSFGWPIVLIIIGLVVVAVGYGSVSFGRKYLQSSESA